ncbi:MAG TPA: hypothetical protein VN437_00850 [Rectinemataceae bacterium]|nr:hypothetical protein [Rectinemataceae bacterium]
MDTAINNVEEAEPVAELARRQFGIDYLFLLQRMSIANILDAVESDSPVRQLVLMNDQKNSLDRRGIPSALFRGGLEDWEWRMQCDLVKSGKAKIVITNPECLVTPG